MNIEEEIFDGFQYIHLKNAENGIRSQAVPAEQIKDLICISDENLWPDDLIMVEGSVVYGTGMFMRAFFTTIDGETDYCFQDGRDNYGNDISTLVKVVNRGTVDPYLTPFLRTNQVITRGGELLEAYYLATYKDGKWFILDRLDRDSKLDCESSDVLSRAQEFVFKEE